VGAPISLPDADLLFPPVSGSGVTVEYGDGIAFLYSYAAPSSLGGAENGVSVAGVTFDPPSPQPAGTEVSATVSFSGPAAASRIFFVSLASDTAGLDGAAKHQFKATGETPAPKTFAFTVPSANVEDFDLSFTSPPIVHPASIKNTFGISAAEETGVSDTFNAVHGYVSSRTAAQLASDGIIETGDYIDLEGGITVIGGTGPDGINSNEGIPDGTVANDDMGADGARLRIIVVGVNSFNAGGSGGGSAYTGNGNGEDAHLVFQFRNVPFTHRMDYDYTIPSYTSANGYAGSEMQAYLTSAFLPGLYGAGVPSGILWAPKRYVADKGGPDAVVELIEDYLWLPTEREMGSTASSGNYRSDVCETEENQARLEYYTDKNSRIKNNPTGEGGSNKHVYWLASPSPLDSSTYGNRPNSFCCIYSNGASLYDVSSIWFGVVPAFCVK
jgi:hypothetical protein